MQTISNLKRQLFIPLCLFLLCSSLSANAQRLKDWEKAAVQAYTDGNYSAALAYNEKLLEISPGRTDALFYGAESARHMRAMDKAEANYLAIPKELRTGMYALTDFWLGSIYKSQGKYAKASDYFDIFLAQNSSNQNFVDQAMLEKEYCNWALLLLGNPNNILVAQMDSTVNTKYTDIAPMSTSEGFYYTSAWFEDFGTTPHTRIFRKGIGEDKAQPWGYQPVMYNEHVGHVAFSANGQRVYFTICTQEDSKPGFNCEIYFQENGFGSGWSNPVRLGNDINIPGTSSTQPSISFDPILNKEVLFFASNRSGGKGNLDIWYSELGEDGQFAPPINVDAINTPQDDITPFFHGPSGTLFFSSGGWMSLGGLDVLMTRRVENVWQQPDNMGSPLNSGFDDLYFVFDSKQGNGYLASNRPGATCGSKDNDCVCTDIYKVDIKVSLEATVFNAVSNQPINGVTLSLVNTKTGIADTVSMQELNHKFNYGLNFNQEYLLVASKEGYTSDTVALNTEGMLVSKKYEEKLVLKPEVRLEVLVFDALTRSPLDSSILHLSVVDSKLPRLNDSNLKSNDYLKKVDFEKIYKILIEREGWSSGEASFDTKGLSEPTVIKREVYLTKGVALPLALYFDNDYPDPNSIADVASVPYLETYNRYIKQQANFKSNYSQGLKGNAKKEAESEIEAFFINDVKKGHDDLILFTEEIYSYLKNGFEMEIIFKGFASPLAATDYNDHLSNRRIDCLKKHFYTWNNGVLMPYLDSKSLLIKEDPLGEKTAEPTISDATNNRRMSEFSPQASKERKVMVLDFKKSSGSLSLKY